MRYLRRALAVCALVALVMVAAMALPAVAPVAAQTKSLEWTRLDSDVTVQPNGDLQIVETNVINFTSGTFTFGYRDIQLTNLTNVTNIKVTEQGRALQVQTSRPESNVLRIRYSFSAASNEERTFQIAYTIQGATRYYPDGDQVYWVAVYPDRNGYSVLSSRVTVHLPGGATAQKAEVYGVPATVTGQNESTVVAVANQPIDSGQEMEVRVQFPHGIISGSAPAWQAAYDQQRTYDETTKPMIDFGFLLAALVVLVGGPGLAVALWYTRGRDPNVGLIADYLNEPPPGVAPGVAGTLVDEKADMQDVIATLIDLARRGVITMKEEAQPGFAGLVMNRDWAFSRGPQFGAAAAPYERQLLDALDLTRRDERELSDLKNKFYTHIPGIKTTLYDQLVQEGYYSRSPEKTRGLYSSLGVLFMVLAIVGAVILGGISDSVSSTAICVAFALGVTSVVFFIVAQAMPARTRKGAETKMRLEAFRRYLQNIEKYVDIKTATDQFDKYLPFAIAFGIDRSWVNKFASVDAPAPGWYIPYYGGYGYGRHQAGVGGVGGVGSAGDISGAARAPVTLEGVNKGMSNSLSNLNAGLTAMFSTVATTFVSTPAPKSSGSGFGGGGWSGGGGGGGGGSGGGGGGFG